MVSSGADIAELRQELEVNAGDYSALQQLAQVFEQQGEWQELLELAQWQSSLCKDDQRLTGYLDYLAGRALLELDRPEQAESRLLRCIPSLRDFAYAHNQLGRCHAELEDWDLAVAAQERCLALKPDFGYAWMELARGREELGECSKAVEAYEQAAVLLPDNPWLKRRLAILKISASLKAGETKTAAGQIQSLLGSEEVNEELLQQWLDSVATLAACGEWSEAIQLASAIHQGEQLAGRPTSLGTRCSLLFMTSALLMAGDGPQGLHPSALAGALLETRWLPVSKLEKKLWQKVFTDLLTTAVTRIVVASPAEQILPDCGALLLAIADVVVMIYRDPELARSLLQAGIQLKGMPDDDQLRLRESSGLLALKSAADFDASSGQSSLTSNLSQKELWKLLDRVAPDGLHLTETQKTDRHLILELVDKSGQFDQFKRVKDSLGKGRYLEALQDFEAIPKEHCSSRVLIAVNLCRLSISGLHLPQDILCLREVAQQLLQHFRKQSRSSRMRRDLEEVLLRLNTRIYQDTEQLSRRVGPIERVQQIRSIGLELLSELTTGCLNPPGLPPSFSRKKSSGRWLLIANKDLPQCFLYRVEQKRQQLESLYCDVEVVYVEELNSWCIANKLLWADRLVVCRLPGTYQALRVIELAHRFGVEVLYDIDDLIFDAENFPPPLSSYGGTISEAVHAGLAMDAPAFMAAMKQADRLIFSTPTLASRWKDMQSDLSKPVHVLPNLAPPELLRAAIDALSRLEQHHQKPLRLLVSSGTLAHKQVWEEELAPALREILKRYPEVQLDLVGSVSWPDNLQETELSGRIRSVPFSDFPAYLNHLRRAHIGLAPLEPGIVTDAKSAIKWMEYSMLGLASVVSPTVTYRDDLSEGEHVLFASDQEGWVRAIDRLISDKSLRVEMAKRAHDHAKDLFGPGVGEQ
ncbi:MAG: glycosyltransferase, partial [Prochlorococcus sp.]